MNEKTIVMLFRAMFFWGTAQWMPVVVAQVPPEREKAVEARAADSSPPERAEAIVAKGENYVVLSYRKTKLQNHLLGSNNKDSRSDYTTYVLIDGDSMFHANGQLNEKAMNWENLSKEVRALRRSKSSIATFHMMHGDGPGDRRLLTWLFKGFGHSQAGYSTVYWTSSSGSADFWRG